jgi:hypothetical protein
MDIIPTYEISSNKVLVQKEIMSSMSSNQQTHDEKKR